MRKALLVYLKDTFYSGRPGAAQWQYARPDAEDLILEVRGSGLLWIGKENPEAPVDERGKRRETVAVFPAGGWSGYAWEPIPAELAAELSGLEIAR